MLSARSEGVQLRGHLSGSTLVNLLDSRLQPEVKASRQDMAERLGMWLNVADGMSLHAGLQHAGLHQTQTPGVALPRGAGLALQEACQQAQDALAASIMTTPLRLEPAQGQPAFAPYHQLYGDLQRHMSLQVETVRQKARHTLSQASGRLAQLAVLDDVMQQALGVREQKALSAMPALLEQLFRRSTLAPSVEDETVLSLGGEGADTDGFLQEMRALLLAELDVRMQPVWGLVDAFNREFELNR